LPDQACCLIRLAVACLEETLAHYVAAAVTYARGINDAFLRRMAADHADICDFFERFCLKEKARPVLPSVLASASPHFLFMSRPVRPLEQLVDASRNALSPLKVHAHTA
jgi:hypothetical protein